VFFPQTHRPGAEAEVDFGEVAINLRGELVTCMLFAFRLSFSGNAVHKIFLRTKDDHLWWARSSAQNWHAMKRGTGGGARGVVNAVPGWFDDGRLTR
jgi:hypothetical protein